MSSQNTVIHSNGQLLTGKLWRMDHPFFNDLPFYSDILRMDNIGEELRRSLSMDEWYGVMLVVSNLMFYCPKLITCNRKLERV